MTLNPTVTFMDSGELAAAVATFGIPHPTGYPLFLIIGYIFANLPLGGSVIYKLNILSALLSALAVYVTFFASYEFLNLIGSKIPARTATREDKKKKINEKKSEIIPERLFSDTAYFKPVIALTAAVLLGLTKTFWQNALSVEVYPLHVLILSLIILYCLKVYSQIGSKNKKLWTILFLLAGFGFTNHMTTIFILPAILYLFYLEYKKDRIFTKSLIKRIPFFLIPLLLYFVLMSRSATEPFMNWSAPSDFSNLLYHITGGDYSQMMFSSGSFSKQFKILYSEFFTEFAVIGGILGLLGLINLFKLEKKIFTIFLFSIIFCLFYSVYYGIRDIQSYFLTAYYFIAICSSLGLVWLINIIHTQFKLNMKSSFLVLIVVSIIVIGFSINYNFNSNDNSRNYIIDDYTKNALKDLEPNSIVITYDWGYLYPAALYYQQVEHFRQDIKIFNIKFLSVPWYIETIKRYYPDVYKNVENEAEFYKLNYTSEKNLRSQALMNFVKAFIEKNISRHSLFASYDFAYSNELKPLFTGFAFQGDGLLYKIRTKNSVYDSSSGITSLLQNFREYLPLSKEAEKMKTVTAGIFYDNALYHSNNGNRPAAIRFINKSLEIKPDFAYAVNLKNQLDSQKDTVK